MENILRYRHHTEESSIDNTNNYCILVHADLPVLLFVYCHFTKYKLFIHSKLIIEFWCLHITCCALLYSHCTSPKKVKKKCIPACHQTSLIFCWVFCFCRIIFQTIVILVPDHLEKCLSGTVTKLLLLLFLIFSQILKLSMARHQTKIYAFVYSH
jgi:hypothetical protein